jgi:hypothetical protein
MTTSVLAPPRPRSPIVGFEQICAGALEQLGLVAEGGGEAVTVPAPEFVAWGALVLKGSGFWLDLDVTLDRASANVLLDTMLGSVPDSDDDLLDALRETLNIVQGSLKGAVISKGEESFSPIIPVATTVSTLQPLAATRDAHVYVHAAQGMLMRIAVFTAASPERSKRPRQLVPGDLLTAPVLQQASGTLLLNKGILLTERYINRLVGIAERTDTPFDISVIEPPPGTRPRLRNLVQ